jgi:hypothetical protein
MRAFLGIGGLLVALGVVVWLMSAELGHDKAVIDAGNKATDQINVVAGRDQSGAPVKESATLEPQQLNGKTESILVTSVVADGPYAKVWGLQRNDAIVEIGPLPVSQVVTDAGAADDFVMDAYQHGEALTVFRDGKKIELNPQSALTPALSGAPNAAPSNGAPTAPPPANRPGSVQSQLDAIQQQAQQIPTH